MDFLGERRFVDVPGNETHELPPLLVRMTPNVKRLDRVMDMANDLIEQEDMIPVRPEDAGMGFEAGGVSLSTSKDSNFSNFHVDRGDFERLNLERRRWDLATNLVDQYLGFVQQWQWGDSIVEWIRQCETTFEMRTPLRHLLRPDVWPHAARSSFVTLLEDRLKLEDKLADTLPSPKSLRGIELEKAVGMRLTFRQPPPLKCFSNQFLFYLNHSVANTAYQTWAQMSPSPISALPPERFRFEVLNMSLD